MYGSLVNGGDRGQRTASGDHSNRSQQTRGGSSYWTTASNSTCPFCASSHSPFACDKFRGMKVQDRIKIAREKNLCFNCLKPGHMSARCRFDRCCTVDDCKQKHTKFLHPIQPRHQRECWKKGVTDQCQCQIGKASPATPFEGGVYQAMSTAYPTHKVFGKFQWLMQNDSPLTGYENFNFKILSTILA